MTLVIQRSARLVLAETFSVSRAGAAAADTASRTSALIQRHRWACRFIIRGSKPAWEVPKRQQNQSAGADLSQFGTIFEGKTPGIAETRCDARIDTITVHGSAAASRARRRFGFQGQTPP